MTVKEIDKEIDRLNNLICYHNKRARKYPRERITQEKRVMDFMSRKDELKRKRAALLQTTLINDIVT